MTEHEPQFLDVPAPGGAVDRIAYLRIIGGGPDRPGLLWLKGFKSEMTSTKATALAAWAAQRGLACVRFDYSGHGRSGGCFEEGTIGAWLGQTRAVFDRLTDGPQIVVGSSMGAWLALLLARSLQQAGAPPARLKALVLIAPAWDMTETLMWQRFPKEARRAITERGEYLMPSDYGEPYAITRALIEEGRSHLIGGAPFDPGCPLRIIHGRGDADVPWEHSVRLMELIAQDDMRLTLVKDGDHRLSREQDLALLFATIDGVLAQSPSPASARNPSR